jgi:hypothetical protein
VKRNGESDTHTHQLRTPLQAILGYSEMLLERKYDEHTTRSANKAVYFASKGVVVVVVVVVLLTPVIYATVLLRSITDILDYTQMTTHELKFHPFPFKLQSQVTVTRLQWVGVRGAALYVVFVQSSNGLVNACQPIFLSSLILLVCVCACVQHSLVHVMLHSPGLSLCNSQ